MGYRIFPAWMCFVYMDVVFHSWNAGSSYLTVQVYSYLEVEVSSYLNVEVPSYLNVEGFAYLNVEVSAYLIVEVFFCSNAEFSPA